MKRLRVFCRRSQDRNMKKLKYTDFRHWCDSKKMSNTTENVLLAYIFRGKVEDFEAVNIVVPFFLINM
jgi:hypothetical protein